MKLLRPARSFLALFSSLIITETSRGDLLLYYPFDIENGTVVENQGTLADGTLVGGGTYGPSIDASFGTAFVGNRATLDDAHVATGLVGDDLGMGAGGVYTAMAWINWAGASGNADHMVFGQDDLDPEGNVAQLHHGVRDDSVANVHFGGWGGTQDIADAGTVPAGTWTHVAWQYDGVDAVVYVDGVETARAVKNNITNPALQVLIGGSSRDGTLGKPFISFNGSIDEVRVYDEALTAQQIGLISVPGADNDVDGLSNDDEVNIHGTDPNDADSDDDGIIDGTEISNGLDPNSSIGDDGADGDPDGDNLGNLEELQTHRTDPQVADTDGDNLDDGDEIAVGSDPRVTDSDGDTLTDGDEVNIHMTNPILEDSDVDGWDDAEEIAAGTDPNDPDSKPDPGALPEPLLYYSFESPGATTIENLGSLGTAGTLNGGVTFDASVDASYGDAFYGNRTGDNDAYVITGFTGEQLGMGGGGVYTAMAWINWAGHTVGNTDHMVFGQDDGAGNNAQLHHGIRAEGPDANVDNIHFGGWGTPQDLSDAGTVPPSTWTHVAWQYDGTDKVVYVNGIESSRGVGNNISTPALSVLIGTHGRGSDTLNNSFDGALDEVKIYGVALNAGQIQAAMAPGETSSTGLEITSIVHNGDGTVSITFNSRPGRTYTLYSSNDLQFFAEVDDAVAAHATDPTTTLTLSTTVINPNPPGPAAKAFLYLQENPRVP